MQIFVQKKYLKFSKNYVKKAMNIKHLRMALNRASWSLR